MPYETPEVEDLGTLAEMTLALGFIDQEDGASKAIPLHHDVPPSSIITP